MQAKRLSDRDVVRALLRAQVVTTLRESGFAGEFPHLRRRVGLRLDFISFQFDKYGGGFIVEIGQVSDGEPVVLEGKAVPFAELNSWTLPFAQRARLRRSHRGLPESWFRYEKTLFRRGDERFQRAVALACERMPQALAWFEGERPQPNIKELSRA